MKSRSHRNSEHDAAAQSVKPIRALGLAAVLSVFLIAQSPVATAQTTSVTDPMGDLATPNALIDVPFAGPITISGDQLSFEVPDFLLPDPIDNWLAFSYPSVGAAPYDVVPDMGLINGTGGTVGDPTDPMLDGDVDILSAAILEAGDNNTFQIAVREFEDPLGAAARFAFGLDYETGPPDSPDRFAGLDLAAPSADGFLTFVSWFGPTPIPYVAANYYDLVAASLEETPTQLIARFTTATAIPTGLPSTTGSSLYSPAFRVAIDTDGNPNTGDFFGNDRLYGAYFDPSGTFVGVAREFMNGYLQLTTVGAPTVSQSGDQITITIPRTPFTLNERYSWGAAADLVVSDFAPADADDYWFLTADVTSRSGPFIFGGDFETNDFSQWSSATP